MPNTLESTSNFPLHDAVRSGYLDEVQASIEAGVDIDGQDENLRTALHLATQQGRENIIEELLECGARTDLQDRNGFTVWHQAVLENRSGILEQLLRYITDENRFELNLQAIDGSTPLDLAIEEGRTRMVEILLQHGCVAKIHTLELAQINNETISKIKEHLDQDEDADIYLHNAKSNIPYDSMPKDLQTFASHRYFRHQERAGVFPAHWTESTKKSFLILRHRPILRNNLINYLFILRNNLEDVIALPEEIREQISIELCMLHFQKKYAQACEDKTITYDCVRSIRIFLQKTPKP